MTKFKRNRKQPSAILTSDWHLREKSPICRIDDYWNAQNKKVDFIFDLAKQYRIPIFIAGDLGHKPKWSCRLLEWFIEKIDKDIEIFVTPGQHDLINHKLDLWDHAAIGVLQAAGVINLMGFNPFLSIIEFDNFYLRAFPYGKELSHKTILNANKPIVAMTHQMIVQSKDLFPDQKAIKGHNIINEFNEYSIILSGDNHSSFVSIGENNKLINPGSMMRSTTIQDSFLPKIYLWYADDNNFKKKYLPIEKDVISRDHIKEKDDRIDRFNSYVEKLKEDVELDLSMEDNMVSYLKKYRTEKPVKNKIMEAMNG